MVSLELLEHPAILAEKRAQKQMEKIRGVGAAHADCMGIQHPANVKIFTDGYIQGLHEMIVIAQRKGLRIQIEDLLHGG